MSNTQHTGQGLVELRDCFAGQVEAVFDRQSERPKRRKPSDPSPAPQETLPARLYIPDPRKLIERGVLVDLGKVTVQSSQGDQLKGVVSVQQLGTEVRIGASAPYPHLQFHLSWGEAHLLRVLHVNSDTGGVYDRCVTSDSTIGAIDTYRDRDDPKPLLEVVREKGLFRGIVDASLEGGTWAEPRQRSVITDCTPSEEFRSGLVELVNGGFTVSALEQFTD